MRVAVISDIHSNYKALEAFLSYMEDHPADAVICLGDYVTDGPYPERTLSLLHEMEENHPCFLIRGNREEYLLENRKQDQGWHICSASGALYYTYQRLTQADLDWMESMPSERKLRLENCPELTVCHGAPGMIRGNFTLERVLQRQVLERLETGYLLGGHSHCQEICKMYGKVYLNPGSLGMAIDEQGRHAQFAMMEGDSRGWEMEQITMDYDVEGYLRDIRESGIEEYGLYLTRAMEKTLVTGHNYFYDLVCAVSGMSHGAPQDIEEDVWRRAAQRMGLC